MCEMMSIEIVFYTVIIIIIIMIIIIKIARE